MENGKDARHLGKSSILQYVGNKPQQILKIKDKLDMILIKKSESYWMDSVVVRTHLLFFLFFIKGIVTLESSNRNDHCDEEGGSHTIQGRLRGLCSTEIK